MLLYNLSVFSGAITGTTPVYSPASLNAELGRAGRWFATLRTSQGVGTNPKVTIELQDSFDNVDWRVYDATLISGQDIPASSVLLGSGANRGTSGGTGPFIRFKFQLSALAGTPGGNLDFWVCGRDDL